jgi:C4-type Zn-finger protein
MATKVSPVSVAKTLGTCPVCKSDIRKSDPVVSCPYCGTLAHRDHLLEYLHVKGNCPSCGKRLNEKEIKEHLARAKTRIASQKGVGLQDTDNN